MLIHHIALLCLVCFKKITQDAIVNDQLSDLMAFLTIACNNCVVYRNICCNKLFILHLSCFAERKAYVFYFKLEKIVCVLPRKVTQQNKKIIYN